MITLTRSPTPAEITALIESCGRTQETIALLLHVNSRTVRQWKAGDRRMHPAFWELLKLKLARKKYLQPELKNP